jgi:hypothetical protein
VVEVELDGGRVKMEARYRSRMRVWVEVQTELETLGPSR